MCRAGLDCLTNLIANLGMIVNWKKVEGPSQILSFLGVEIDCVKRTLSLLPKKLAELKLLVKTWLGRHRCVKKELQSLIGKLNWAARVVQGGRTFLRNFINLLPNAKNAHHHIRLSKAARADLMWWDSALIIFHGYSPFLNDLPLPSCEFGSDASLIGGGAHFGSDWIYLNWERDFPAFKDSHINVLELKTVLESVKRWASLWSGCHICVRSDNSATVASINKGSSRSPDLLLLIQELFWLSVQYSFKLSASFIPGKINYLADRISRLDLLPQALDAYAMLSNFAGNIVPCKDHMSPRSFVFLQDRWNLACRR
jgi:hypothetical protein